MDHFHYQDGRLFAEAVDLTDIAQQYGTPCYIYSRATIERHWHAFNSALSGHSHLICYSVKANSNLAILNILARLGSGFDIVSVGELERVLRAGGDPAQIVFSGVGKRADEMYRALEVGIKCFNIESLAELQRLNRVAAELNCIAPVSLRVNPDVDALTHPYISTGLKENKFGIAFNEAVEAYQTAATMSHLRVIGIDCHIGSQLTEIRPFTDALERILVLIDTLAEQEITIEHLDLGGGLGITYQDETPPTPDDYATAISQQLAGHQLEIIIEPGRAIVGNAGILLTEVQYLKFNEHKNFAVVDAAMNDLLRPSLYDAWQKIIPLQQQSRRESRKYDVVGPVCESGDFLGKDRSLAIEAGDLLAVRSSGAYGFSMSSNYNSRPRVAELLVDGSDLHLIRRRETVDELMALEQPLPK